MNPQYIRFLELLEAKNRTKRLALEKFVMKNVIDGRNKELTDIKKKPKDLDLFYV